MEKRKEFGKDLKECIEFVKKEFNIDTDDFKWSKENALSVLDIFIRELKSILILNLKRSRTAIRKYMGFNNDLFQFKQIIELNINTKNYENKELLTKNKNDLLRCELLRIKSYSDDYILSVNLKTIQEHLLLLYTVMEVILI
jgi:hypothetical protein